jgi:phosphoribosyl 1,2-cyclic phosphodiesterase
VRYGGHTSCVALAHDGDASPTILLDAGTGIRRVTGLCGPRPFTGTILLTHLHWDHTQGLPFFGAGDRDDARGSLFLPEQPGGMTALEALARGMSPPHFPIRPDGLRGEWTFSSLTPGQYRVEGFTVDAVEIPHKGGRTFGYRVGDGRSTLAYIPDHCPTVLGPGPDGWGEYHQGALDLAAGADVVVHDAQMLPEEAATHASFGHSVADYAVGLGNRAGAHSVMLFHHAPDRTDDALDALANRLGSAGRVTVASESTVLEL